MQVKAGRTVSGPRDSRASPVKLAHFVLVTRDLPRLRDWYLALLEGRVAYEDPVLCFLTYDEEHHRIAIGALPGDPEELIARSEAGEPFEALRRRPKLPPGKTPLDMTRD